MAFERLIPGGVFINETSTAQRLIPGDGFVNETIAAVIPPEPEPEPTPPGHTTHGPHIWAGGGNFYAEPIRNPDTKHHKVKDRRKKKEEKCDLPRDPEKYLRELEKALAAIEARIDHIQNAAIVNTKLLLEEQEKLEALRFKVVHCKVKSPKTPERKKALIRAITLFMHELDEAEEELDEAIDESRNRRVVKPSLH